jgi:hypothetical protein
MENDKGCWLEAEMAKLSPERRERIEREVDTELLKMDLQQLRDGLGVTQTQLVEALASTQGEVSKLDHRFSTIRRVVEALGGQVDIRCSLGDKQVSLKVM